MTKKILLGTLLTGLLVGSLAHADRYDRRWHQAHWHEGRWIHDRHNGQLGWWWVIGDDWHFYVHPVAQPQMVIIQQPAPVMVQQAPAPVMVAPVAAPAPVTPTMYYCKATERYYPETMTCPNGWTPITAGAPPAP
jgi:hypothetical protein